MKAFHSMISMEMSDDEKIDESPWRYDVLISPEEKALKELAKPEFPYGLRICLTHREFEKLKLDPDDAEVGAIFHGHFIARVTSVNSSNGDMGKCCRVEAQIEDLEIESEDEENEEEEENEKY